MNSRRVVLIGWDGASWPVLQKYVSLDKLPTLKKLLLGGVAGDLKSTVPFHSGPAWMSIVTGVNPGKHNIFHFCRSKGYDMQLANGSFRRSMPIWDIISQAGMKVAVVNIPMTYPPTKVNGVMVSGMDTPSDRSRFTYPDSLRDELTRTGYRITWGSKNFNKGKGEEEFVAKILEMSRKRGGFVVSLLQNLKPDFLVVNFASPDRIQHFFWHTIGVAGADRVCEIYQELDSILSDILESIDESTTIFVVSDHGFGPLYKTVAIGKWLRDEGLLKLRSRIPKYLLRRLGTTIERIGGGGGLAWASKWVPQLKRNLETAKIDAWSPDWSKTRAWFPPTTGGVKINLRGREPRGIVNQGGEYEELCDHVSRKLENLRDPDNGKKVIEKVHRREGIYSGSYTANAPDLIIQPARGYAVGKTGRETLMSPSRKRPQTGNIRILVYCWHKA